MNTTLPAQEAVCQLLAGAWDPASLPLPDSVPWREALRLAITRNVGPAVYELSRGMSAALPPDVLHELEQEHYRTIEANTRCLHQLSRVWKVLSSLGAPLLLLKGAALDQALYRGIAPRPIGDIDLLAPKEYIPTCRKALIELGYVPAHVDQHAGDRLQRTSQEQFTPPPPYQAPVELHWHILDIPYYMHRLPMDWFWEKTESLSIDGQAFRVLNPEANLIYLPAHLAFHHRFNMQHNLYDLALLITQNQDRIDWHKVIAAACSFELVSALRAALERLAECWPVLPIEEPRRALNALQPSPADSRLFHLLTAQSRTTMLDHYTTLISLPGFAARARYVWATLFPQPAYMMTRYNIKRRWQLPCWYLYRLVAGLFRFVRILPGAQQIDQ